MSVILKLIKKVKEQPDSGHEFEKVKEEFIYYFFLFLYLVYFLKPILKKLLKW
jgi:hypothetical protein